MTGSNYQNSAMRTWDKLSKERLSNILNVDSEIDFGGVINGCLGLSGEVGEFNDVVKKSIFHEKELDEEHLKKELGDILWYVAQICESFNWDLDEVMELNIDKLRKRYPEGFSVERANNREESDI